MYTQRFEGDWSIFSKFVDVYIKIVTMLVKLRKGDISSCQSSLPSIVSTYNKCYIILKVIRTFKSVRPHYHRFTILLPPKKEDLREDEQICVFG